MMQYGVNDSTMIHKRGENDQDGVFRNRVVTTRTPSPSFPKRVLMKLAMPVCP